MTNEGTKELTREEIRALANAVLDTLGIEDVERSDEEWRPCEGSSGNEGSQRRTKRIYSVYYI